jgi:hypothetical protein
MAIASAIIVDAEAHKVFLGIVIPLPQNGFRFCSQDNDGGSGPCSSRGVRRQRLSMRD